MPAFHKEQGGSIMESRVKIAGHPVHQMLIPFPLGLLATAVIFDIVWLITGTAVFETVAFHMIIAGIIGGFAAAPFGLVDWLAIPANTRARSVGMLHGLGNVVVLLLFIGSCWLRYNDAPANTHIPTTLALILSFAGASLAVVTGWLGGELVDRLGVG